MCVVIIFLIVHATLIFIPLSYYASITISWQMFITIIRPLSQFG